ncbi:MAG: thioredoxin family protein [Marinicellaceae bacterium]
MIKKLSLLLLIFTFVANAGKYNAILNLGDAMPEFTNLPAIDGTSMSSKDLKEDVIVMVMLANHCPWVKGMDQDLVKLADSFKDKSVKVVGLSVNLREDDRLEAMKVHAKKVGYNFSYVFDESQELGRQLGATRTPEYFVFDKDRKLQYMGLLYNSPAKMNKDGSVRHINGEVTENYAFDAISALLAGKKVAMPETRAHGCSVKYEQ